MSVLNVRRLAALDMWGTRGTSRRRRLIRLEFFLGAIGCTGLGVYMLVTPSGWMLVLGIWLVGAGVNYIPLARHAQSLSRPGALEDELRGADLRRDLRRAGIQQLWIAVPFAVAFFELAGNRRPRDGWRLNGANLTSNSELEIRARPNRLFDLLGPERTPVWDRSIVSVTETRAPLRVGARYRETHRIFLRSHEIDLEVTEYDPPLRIAYRTVSGGPPSSTRYELLAGPELTTVRITAAARVGGPLFILAPLLRRVMRRQLPATLDALKNYCEAH